MTTLARDTMVGEYRLIEKLGSGGMGEVWLAERVLVVLEPGEAAEGAAARLAPRARYAVKVATTPAGIRALRRQGAVQGRLDHPGIVRVVEARPADDPPFVVFELIAGESLRGRLRSAGPLGPDEAATLLYDVTATLAHAHSRGIAHGDLKPENILLDATGRPKVTDFGLGRTTVETPEGTNSLATNEVGPTAGTLAYLAPERLEGRPNDPIADLYALGAVLFEVLTGRLPQGRDLPSEHVANLDTRFDEVFARCYTARERRYRSADEAAAALADLAAHPFAFGDPSEVPPFEIVGAGAAPAASKFPTPRTPASPPRDAVADWMAARPRLVGLSGRQPRRPEPFRPAPSRGKGFVVGCLAGLLIIGVLAVVGLRGSEQEVRESAPPDRLPRIEKPAPAGGHRYEFSSEASRRAELERVEADLMKLYERGATWLQARHQLQSWERPVRNGIHYRYRTSAEHEWAIVATPRYVSGPPVTIRIFSPRGGPPTTLMDLEEGRSP